MIMNDKDFEKIEHLLQTKGFEELTPAEKEVVLAQISETDYSDMRELFMHTRTTRHEEIVPPLSLKGSLDKALAARRPTPIYVRTRLPLYQVAAVALLFLVVGLVINYTKETPIKVVTNTIREVKYINRPVKQVQYIVIPAKYAQKIQPIEEARPQLSTNDNQTSYPEITGETNPEILRQQEIVMSNIQRTLNEKNGISVGQDSLLQKMLVTIY
jgi:hypothetical protein